MFISKYVINVPEISMIIITIIIIILPQEWFHHQFLHQFPSQELNFKINNLKIIIIPQYGGQYNNNYQKPPYGQYNNNYNQNQCGQNNNNYNQYGQQQYNQNPLEISPIQQQQPQIQPQQQAPKPQ